MKRVQMKSGALTVRNSQKRQAFAVAFAANVAVLVSPGPAHGADQPRSLSVQDREVVRLVKPPGNGRVYDLAFSPRRGSAVCAFALEQTVQVWDLSAGHRLVETLKPPLPKEYPPEAARMFSHPIAFSSDGSRLAMAYVYSEIQIWDFDNRKILFAVKPSLWVPEAIGFSRADLSLVIGCSWRGAFSIDGRFPSMVKLVPRAEHERMPGQDSNRPEMSQEIRPRRRGGTGPQAEEDVYCVAFSPGGKWVYSGGGPVFAGIPRDYSRESSVTAWECRSGARLFAVGSKELPILRFCLSPGGRVLYSCGAKVLAWDATKSASPINEFDTSGRRMIAIAVSPDGAMLAAGAADGTVVIWDADSTALLATLTHSAGPVYRLDFCHDGTRLVAAGEQGVATVWDIELTPRK
jgi:WD40 repeat protein